MSPRVKKKTASKLRRSSRTKMSLDFEELAGGEAYSTWISMLKVLVPHGRTHRFSVVVAGMLYYAWERPRGKENRIGKIFDESEGLDYEEMGNFLKPVVEQLFKDAKVKWKRKNSRGHGYSIAEDSIQEFLKWDFMPWE